MTLKLMVRREDAPKETSKFLGMIDVAFLNIYVWHHEMSKVEFLNLDKFFIL